MNETNGVSMFPAALCAALLLALAAPAPGRAAEAPAPQQLDTEAPRELSVGFLPRDQIFNSLIADPRWPHFSVAYHYYLDDPDLGNVAAISLGESIILYRDRIGKGKWEVGIQAGVFAIFDLDAPSMDLVNADYVVGLVAGYRNGRLSGLGRLFHQSSHLGDEYIFTNLVEDRVNLSYQAVDLRVSYEFPGDVLRLCIGGGNIFQREPSSIKPWSLQTGLDLRRPWPSPEARLRPVAAADVQYREENNWQADISLRAGIEFQRWLGSRNLQLLIEYFRGHSPNGQFYTEDIDHLGLGMHFNF